ERALALARRALDSDESRENKALFARCIKESPSLAASSDLRPVLMRALLEPWVRPDEFATAIVRSLKADATVRHFIDRVTDAGPGRAAALLHDLDFNALASDELLSSLLTTALVADLQLERVFTTLRAALLRSVREAPEH